MKKVLLVCDGNHFSEAAFKMAAYLQTLQPILLTGVFLGAEIYKYVYLDVDYTSAELAVELQEEQEKQITQSTQRFKKLCTKYGIEYRVHEDWESFPLDNLKKEMRFADLAIIGNEVFYKDFDDEHPNSHLKTALHNAECPVLLVPEKFESIDNILLAYNGNKASVFAIKQLVSLLPELCKKEILLVYAAEDNKEIPDLTFIEELAARHFPNLTLYKLDINPKAYFATWLSERKNTLVVTGSFGRSEVSVMWNHSFITDVIQEHDLPIFVAHP
jgi:hypothetical protein